jgi:hypothetical protein
MFVFLSRGSRHAQDPVIRTDRASARTPTLCGKRPALDAVALSYAVRLVRRQATARRLSFVSWLRRTTDPAATTEVVGNSIGVAGRASIVVGGELTFADELNVPKVEQALGGAGDALRRRWPSIDYVYLTPVANPRHRGV